MRELNSLVSQFSSLEVAVEQIGIYAKLFGKWQS